jgi:DNA-binding CsgD family transcriptional regulator
MSEQHARPTGGDLTGAPRRRWMPTQAAGLSLAEYARSLVRRLAALAAVLLTAIWALTGRGYFWPAWAWLGLAVPVLLDFTANWAWRHERGAVRRVACVWALIGVAGTILMLTWLLTWLLAGVHEFWPAWALLGLATAGSAYSLIALHDRVLLNRGRGVARARIGGLRSGLDALDRRLGGEVAAEREGAAEREAAAEREGAGERGGQASVPHVAGTGAPEVLSRLTVREREVLELMAKGRSNTAIAQSMVVTPGAVEKHITNIFSKLDLPACDDDHRRVLAVLAYLRIAR